MSGSAVQPGDACTPLQLAALFESHGLARAVPLMSQEPGAKAPPPVGATGAPDKRLPPDDPQWAVWRRQALEELSFGGRALLSLNRNVIVLDIDTKKMEDETWEQVREPLGEVLAGAGLRSPFNTTHNGRLHGHYLTVGSVSKEISGLLVLNGEHVGEVLRPMHRYICTGGGYRCRWQLPALLSSGLLGLVQRKPKPARRRVPQLANSVDGRQAGRALWDCLPCQPIGEGNRNNGLASVAGILRSRELEGRLEGNDPEELLRRYNAEWCRPPLDDREVSQIWRSIGGRH
ncbi:MAG: primase alpha helix C-terminal domain-containing protein [Chloroflexota bacterium]|nr:primase alpha helix C-terminal domain-containing protein [Chloroflexota bacterium]